MSIDKYAVIGSPISHSKSPVIHQHFAQITGQELTYAAYEVNADNFHTFVTDFFANNGKGFSCTLPLKILAYEYADILTDRARQAKAVNMLAAQADGSILGDNADGHGLVTDLLNHKIKLHQQRVLILGAGGATRGIISPIMQQQPAQLVIANRTMAKAELLATEFQDLGLIIACGLKELNSQQFDVIINATSASLSNELPVLPANILAPQGCCYDLAYANEATPFVRWGLKNNALISIDGVGMLVEQAAEAFYVWRGIRPDTNAMIALLAKSA